MKPKGHDTKKITELIRNNLAKRKFHPYIFSSPHTLDTKIRCSRCDTSLTFPTTVENDACQLAVKCGWTFLKTNTAEHNEPRYIEQVPYCSSCMKKIQAKPREK